MADDALSAHLISIYGIDLGFSEFSHKYHLLRTTPLVSSSEEDRRQPGKDRSSLKKEIEEEGSWGEIKKSWGEIKQMAHNRVRWKAFMAALRPLWENRT